MYLADALLRSTSNDPSVLTLRSDMVSAELFAVEASAMTLCHELRLESAGQMERIAGILCTQSRTIFAEVAMTGLAPLLHRVMHVTEKMTRDLVKFFPRVGVLMVPCGDELALSLGWINGGLLPRKWSGEWKDRIVGVGAWQARLTVSDTYRPQSPEAMLNGAFQYPEVDVGIRAFQKGGVPHEAAVHMTWMANRLLSLGGTTGPEASGFDGILRCVAIAAAIGLGAILQIEAPEIKRSPRPSIREKTTPVDRPVDSRLSIVTLRLTDPEMQRWYETPAEAERRQRRAAARHLVRGHLFATRWGGIAWRKPHWRGDPNRKTLRRLI